MPSSIYKRGPTAPEMNITPLIDVTFLLIIFFMLVNNIKDTQMVEMFIPELHEPRTRPLEEMERIIVNVAPSDFTRDEREESPLLFSGAANYIQVGSDRFPTSDMAGVTAALKREVAKNPKVEVLLRADAALHYEEVEPVMMAIAGAGIEQVNLTATLGEDKGAATSTGDAANGQGE